MRVITSKYILTISGNHSDIELDLTQGQPKLNLTKNVQMSIEDNRIQHLGELKDQFQAEMLDIKKAFLKASDKLKPSSFGTKGTLSFESKAIPSVRPQSRNAILLFRNLGLTEVLEQTYIDSSNPRSLALDLYKYQNIAHLHTSFELFNEGATASKVASVIFNKYKVSTAVAKQQYFDLHLALGLIKVNDEELVKVVSKGKSRASLPVYKLTKLGADVHVFIKAFEAQRQAERNARLSKMYSTLVSKSHI